MNLSINNPEEPKTPSTPTSKRFLHHKNYSMRNYNFSGSNISVGSKNKIDKNSS